MAKNDDERLEFRVRQPAGLDGVESTDFALDEESWSRFVEVVDRPAQNSSGLEKLFAEPSVLRPGVTSAARRFVPPETA